MNNPKLSEKRCLPCEGIGKILTADKVNTFLEDVSGWQKDAQGKIISRTLVMKNFLAAVELIQKIAEVAEGENHHPDIHLTGYRNLNIQLSTHSLGGLTENDFILAAKINQLPAELKEQ